MDPMYFDDRKKNEPSISMRKAMSNIAFVGYVVLGCVLFFGLAGFYGFYRMNESIEYIKERLDENSFYETIRYKDLQPVTRHTMICQVTPLTNHVCSQTSTSFPGDSTDNDRHSADYWVDDKLNIGIQLQRNSANDTNKVGCFEAEGKYEKVRDWATVAFRELGENDTGDKIPRRADKVLVLFRKGELNHCQAVFGDTTEVEP